MKKLFITCLLLASMSSAIISQAQKIEIRIEPVGLVFRSIGIPVEFLITDNISIEARSFFAFRNEKASAGPFIRKDKFRSFSFTAIPKFYIIPKMGNDRLYVAPYLKFLNHSARTEFSSTNITPADSYGFRSTSLKVGAVLGYKVVWKDKNVIDINAGLGLPIHRTSKQDGQYGYATEIADFLEWAGVDALSIISFGYRF